MNSSPEAVEVTSAGGPDAVRESAAIWSQAKARRDQDREPAAVEQAVPGIERRLSIEGAQLLLARQGGRAVGFTLVAPRAQTLEIFYLAVDPTAWGLGVGTLLLGRAEERAREIGRRTLELWVINDNDRAIRVYERSGWVGTKEVVKDPSSGRLERRLLRQLG